MSTSVIAISAPRFPLGDTVITANAHARLDPVDVAQALARHARGDWGNLCPEDVELNIEALDHGDRLLSAYQSAGETFWIITEADRSVTTVLLPEDY